MLDIRSTWEDKTSSGDRHGIYGSGFPKFTLDIRSIDEAETRSIDEVDIKSIEGSENQKLDL